MTKLPFNAACTLAAMTFAACTQEEATDPQPQSRRQPITITAAWPTATPGTAITRVSDFGSGDIIGSRWTTGDKICVTVNSSSTDISMTTTCELFDNGEVKSYDPQIYWQATGRHTIDAWYSNITGCATTDRTVKLRDQTSALAYVLKAEPQVCTYAVKPPGDICLRFVHQLAKVRVKLTAAPGSTADLSTAWVRLLRCYTSCTIDGGTITPTGTADGEVAMKRPSNGNDFFEANVIPDAPGTVRQYNAVEMSVGGTVTWRSLSRPITLEAGKMYTFHFTVK